MDPTLALLNIILWLKFMSASPNTRADPNELKTTADSENIFQPDRPHDERPTRPNFQNLDPTCSRSSSEQSITIDATKIDQSESANSSPVQILNVRATNGKKNPTWKKILNVCRAALPNLRPIRVHEIREKGISRSYSDIDFLNTRPTFDEGLRRLKSRINPDYPISPDHPQGSTSPTSNKSQQNSTPTSKKKSVSFASEENQNIKKSPVKRSGSGDWLNVGPTYEEAIQRLGSKIKDSGR